VAWITAGILGLVTAGGTLYFKTLREEGEEARINEPNIRQTAAAVRFSIAMP
jgi:hypothetical protein